MGKNPHATMFWNDLENDEKLKTCSLAAKGLWTCYLLPIAARSPETGVIVVGSWPSKVGGDLAHVLSNSVGGSPDVLALLIDELVSSGAASVDGKGRLYNRRMVRARQLSETRSKAGKTGADARWQTDGKHHGKTGGKTKKARKAATIGKTKTIPDEPKSAQCDADSKPMHSSCFGASYEEKILNTDQVDMFTAPEGSGADERGEPESGSDAGSRKAKTATRGTRLPDGWQPSPELELFALDLGLDPKSVADEFIDYWRGLAGQKGVKLDWDATFRNRCRQIAERKNSNGRTQRAGQTHGGPADVGAPSVADGISAAFARRYVPT